MKPVAYCDLCGGKNISMQFTNTDRMQGVPGTFQILACADCGLFITSPQLEMHEIAKYYPDTTYYSLTAVTAQHSLLKRLSDYLYALYFGGKGSAAARVLFSPIRPLLRTIHAVPGGRFLDVGCGSGHFMQVVKRFNMDVYGVEPGDFDGASAERLGLNIFHGNLFDAKYQENSFDFISLNHVFEHVPNPTEILAELKRILKPGGRIVIVVPNVMSFSRKVFRRYWVNLDTPRHLFHYAPGTLARYAKKVGLHVRTFRYIPSSFQFLGSIIYVLNAALRRDRYLKDSTFITKMVQGYNIWLNIFVNIPLLPLSYLLNAVHQGDTIEVTMTKNE